MTETNHQRRTEILCTLGPSSMNERVIARLEDLGVNLFRINLSHTALEDLPEVIDYIQSRSQVPICLDTEGAQVRTGTLGRKKLRLRENRTIELVGQSEAAREDALCLYPDWVIDRLEVGDLISIDFNDVLVQVCEKSAVRTMVRVLNGGKVRSNKAVTLHGELSLPPLTEKDRAALRIGAERGLRHIALSFANAPEDVDAIRDAFGREAFVISKIECRAGLANLEEIARRSDAILIDRGDLSREVAIEQIPGVQKRIIGVAKRVSRPVYVATNLLESMVKRPTPTRAEVNDVYNTLVDGADGLVLAAETAIGRHPVGCANMIARLAAEFESGATSPIETLPEDPRSLLVEPHGGRLIRRDAPAAELAEIESLPTLAVAGTDLMDCQQLANGTYSPLTGFMSKETLEAVLEDLHLPSGVGWPMPIILQVPEEAARRLPERGRVVLTDAAGAPHAFLDVEQVYSIDPEQVARRWFGTDSPNHPGVERLLSGGATVVAGDVTSIGRLRSPLSEYQLTPAQTRFLFSHKGWSRVVGFHTRNVAHRVHEYLQLTALRETHADGLYINPVIGPKKAGDFLPDLILESYRLLIDTGAYPAGSVLLGGFATYSRFSGPREAVFTALCRKNMGCSHFIVGRDHAGVADFYKADDTRAMFDQLGSLGIEPIFFPQIGYNPDRAEYAATESGDTVEPISGTQVRSALMSGEAIPTWFMRQEIQDFLRAEIVEGRPVFSA